MKQLNYIVIGGLILVIIFMRMCQTPKTPDLKPIIQTRIDTVYQDRTIEKVVTKPSVRKIVRDTIYREVDSAAILRSYFDEIIYDDTIQIDNIGYIRLREIISENRIVNRETSGHYTFPTIKETTTIQLPPVKSNQVYLGISVGGSKEIPINYFGPDVYLKTKQDKLYTIGLGIGNNTLNYRVGLAWKIKIK